MDVSALHAKADTAGTSPYPTGLFKTRIRTTFRQFTVAEEILKLNVESSKFWSMKKIYLKTLVTLLLVLPAPSFADQNESPTLEKTCTSSSAKGLVIATIGTRVYSDEESGEHTRTLCINAWVQSLEDHFLFCDIKTNSQNDKLKGQRRIYSVASEVKIDLEKNEAVIQFGDEKETYKNIECN